MAKEPKLQKLTKIAGTKFVQKNMILYLAKKLPISKMLNQPP